MGSKRQPQKPKGSRRKEPRFRADLSFIAFLPDDDIVSPLHESFKEYGLLQTELESESDRAAGVLAAALLEWRVSQVINIRVCALGDETHGVIADSWKENTLALLIGKNDGGGQLAFSDQCKLAFCLGAFGPIALDDLLLIGRIRNRFAHRIKHKTFDSDKEVVEFCTLLQSADIRMERIGGERLPRPENYSNAVLRDIYLRTASTLFFSLWQMAHEFLDNQVQRDKLGHQDSANTTDSLYYW